MSIILQRSTRQHTRHRSTKDIYFSNKYHCSCVGVRYSCKSDYAPLHKPVPPQSPDPKTTYNSALCHSSVHQTAAKLLRYHVASGPFPVATDNKTDSIVWPDPESNDPVPGREREVVHWHWWGARNHVVTSWWMHGLSMESGVLNIGWSAWFLQPHRLYKSEREWTIKEWGTAIKQMKKYRHRVSYQCIEKLFEFTSFSVTVLFVVDLSQHFATLIGWICEKARCLIVNVLQFTAIYQSEAPIPRIHRLIHQQLLICTVTWFRFSNH